MNLILLILLVGSNVCSVISNSYLLTPKHNLNHFSSNVDSFVKEHNLNLLVQIDDFVVYETNNNNYQTFETTFNDLFHVEKNEVVNVPNPSEKPVDLHDQFVFMQKPGNDHFDVLSQVPWHLSRVAQRDLPLNDSYPFNYTGSCHTNKNVKINTYVVDTGIDIEHTEFEGRAKWLANFADDEDTDCQSHGTHCAGLVGSRHFGVCKDANLFAIKVLDCRGYGTYSSILKGLAHVYKHHSEVREELGENSEMKLRSVVSMSLGGGYSVAINKVVEKLLSYGEIYVVVAAGNENNDACKVSPASAKGVLTVMASDKDDNRAYFSNYGKCADIYSPGVDITSTIPGDKHAKYSGTSMATPIYAGVVNHYLNMYPDLTHEELREKILGDATKDHIQDNEDDTNNLLVYLNKQSKNKNQKYEL
jgi:cerevisin